jgi:hypothetical protein
MYQCLTCGFLEPQITLLAIENSFRNVSNLTTPKLVEIIDHTAHPI